jgi:hypothetical protein
MVLGDRHGEGDAGGHRGYDPVTSLFAKTHSRDRAQAIAYAYRALAG